MGIPAVLITAVPPVAITVGANRVVKGIAIPNPIGKPDEEKETEDVIRRRLFELALSALATDLDEQTVFSM